MAWDERKKKRPNIPDTKQTKNIPIPPRATPKVVRVEQPETKRIVMPTSARRKTWNPTEQTSPLDWIKSKLNSDYINPIVNKVNNSTVGRVVEMPQMKNNDTVTDYYKRFGFNTLKDTFANVLQGAGDNLQNAGYGLDVMQTTLNTEAAKVKHKITGNQAKVDELEQEKQEKLKLLAKSQTHYTMFDKEGKTIVYDPENKEQEYYLYQEVYNPQSKKTELQLRPFDPENANQYTDVNGIKMRFNNEELKANKGYKPEFWEEWKSKEGGLGDLGESIAQGVGQLATNIVAGQAGYPLMFASGMGQGTTQAINEGSNINEALKYGLGNGIVQVISEKILGGIGGVSGKGFADDVIINNLTGKIKSNTLKNLAQMGIKSTGEGLEEVFAGIGQAVAQKLTYLKKEDLGKLINNQQLLDQFVVGALTSTIGQSGPVARNITKGIDGQTGLNQEQSDKVAGISRREGISYDKAVNKYKQNVEETTKYGLSADYDLTNQVAPINPEKQAIQVVETGNRYSDNTTLSAVKSGMNNTRENRETVLFASKIAQEQQKNITFTKLPARQDGKVINGYYDSKTDSIIINTDSPNLNRFTLGHEIGHVLENTKSYKTMQNKVINTYKTKGIYEAEMKDMADLYQGIDTDLNTEYTNDKIGELFETDKDFVRNLSVEQPSIFKTIKNQVKHLIKMAVPGSSQAKYLESIKYNMEKAYKEAKGIKNSNTDKNGVDFSVKHTEKDKLDSEKPIYQDKSTYSNEFDYTLRSIRASFEALAKKNNIQVAKETLMSRYENSKKQYISKDEFNAILDNLESEYAEKRKNTPPKETYATIKKSIKDKLQSYENFKGVRFENSTVSKSRYINLDYLDDDGDTQTLTIRISDHIRPSYSDQYGMRQDHHYDHEIVSQNLQKIKGDINYFIDESIKEGYFGEKKTTNNKQYSLSKDTLKSKQLDIINKTNPAPDEYHTWIRSIDDIKTAEEVFIKDEFGVDPDFTWEMAENALNTGKIKVYSSYPIYPGAFVTPSKMEAESYAGDGTIYEKWVSTADVAWIDETQGQYATEEKTPKNTEKKTSLSSISQRLEGNQLLDALDLITEVKSIGGKVDKNGYITVYHRTSNENAKKIKKTGIMTAKEDGLFFSTNKNGYAEGYGDTVIKLSIPAEILELDDIFNNEAHLRIPLKNKKSLDVSHWMKSSVKFSIRKDSEGRTLSKEQQEFFKDSKVVDENGNLLVVYHGTNQDNINTFKTQNEWGYSGLYLSDREYVAKNYGGIVKPYYVNFTNPYTVYANNARYDVIKTPSEMKTYTKDKYVDTQQIVAFARDNGYDGVIVENVIENGGLGNDYVAFNSNQIKNIDNTKPTSSDDIRFSLSKDKSLIAMHNLDEDNLLELLELDGIPVPSLAIIDTNKSYNHNDFGHISLIFSSNSIDPKNKDNEVYNTDVYSGRFPNVAKFIDKQGLIGYLEKNGIRKENYYYIESILEEAKNTFDLFDELINVRQFAVYYAKKNNIKLNLAVREFQAVEELYDELMQNNDKGYLDYIRNMAHDLMEFKKRYISNNNNYGGSIEGDYGEYNLNNLVKLMKERPTIGSEFNGKVRNLGSLRARMAKKLDSIEEIKNNKTSIVSYKEMSNFKENISYEYRGLNDVFLDYVAKNDIRIASGQVFDKLNEIILTIEDKETFEDAKSAVEIFYPNIPLTDDLIQDIYDFAINLKNAPTEYFEAKPQRAVRFNEVKYAVLPKYSSKNVVNALNEKGIEIRYYNPSSNESRMSVVKEFNDVKFSLSQKQERDTEDPNIKLLVQDYPSLQDYLVPSAKYYLTIVTDEREVHKGKKVFTRNDDDELTVSGQKRSMPEMIERLRDSGYTYDQIASGLKKIINPPKDNRNYKTAKYIESLLEEEIIEGFTYIDGAYIPGDDNYLIDKERAIALEERAKKLLPKSQKEAENIKMKAFEKAEVINQKAKKDAAIIKDNANIQSELLLQTTKAKARTIEDDAKAKAKQLLDDAQSEIQKRKAEIKEAKIKAHEEIKAQMENLPSITKQGVVKLNANRKVNQNLESKTKHDIDKIIARNVKKLGVEKRADLLEQARSDVENIDNWKFKHTLAGLRYATETMERNVADIIKDPKEADKIIKDYILPISKANAEIKKDILKYQAPLKALKLSGEESIYAQMLGELRFNPETKLSVDDVNNFYKQNQNKINKDKVDSAIKILRASYDELLVRVNNKLIEYGYAPIPYRQGYFPHFVEVKAQSLMGKVLEKLGFKKPNEELPADIAGLTDIFNPGKRYMPQANVRKGDFTDYDALKGFDTYLSVTTDLIHHIDNVQKLRALEKAIRIHYSAESVNDFIKEVEAMKDKTPDEKDELILEKLEQVRHTKAGYFATELHTYTNLLANKNQTSDRGVEHYLGRNTYSVTNQIMQRVSANMVGANISSALTNFIPLTMGMGEISTKNMLRAIVETGANNIRNDGFSDKSVFLTNRLDHVKNLSRTKLEKASDIAKIPFEVVDDFTSSVIVRGKYYDGIDEGLTHEQAMQTADIYAKQVIAGRDKGSMPTAFYKKNPLIKPFLAFQLEVNNQYRYWGKDFLRNIKAGSDDKKEAIVKLITGLFKVFLATTLYNSLMEKLTGRKPAFNPIDIFFDIKDVQDNSRISESDKSTKTLERIMQEIPFIGGMLGGGRLPIQAAIPFNLPTVDGISYLQNTIGKIVDNEEEGDATEGWKTMGKELMKPVYYVVLPFGGGQLKKTVEGVGQYIGKEVAGNYNTAGKLLYEADTSIPGKIQSALFGKYATDKAGEYFANTMFPLSQKDFEIVKNFESIDSIEYRKYKKDLSKLKTNIYDKYKEIYADTDKINGETVTTVKYFSAMDEQIKYINKLDISPEDKNKMVKTLSESWDYDFKMTDYAKYKSFEEYDYKMTKPEEYTAIKEITSYQNYKIIKIKINEIKDSIPGTENTDARKKAIFKYIQSLKLKSTQKALLMKKNYKSFILMDKQIVNYIGSKEIPEQDKNVLFKEFQIDDKIKFKYYKGVV